MSKYGYAGKKLDEKLKMEAMQKRLKEERQENQQFFSGMLLLMSCLGLVLAIAALSIIL